MEKDLCFKALLKFSLGVVAIGILLFLPAGTFHYWKAWLLMGILFIPMLFAGIVLLLKHPDLLKKRLNTKEEQAEQRLVIKLTGLMFLLGFILAGLNFRFGWIIAPDWLSWTGTAIFLLSYMLYAEVLKENAYLSRTVEVQKGQKVVDTGLYRIVRHPMYTITIFYFCRCLWCWVLLSLLSFFLHILSLLQKEL